VTAQTAGTVQTVQTQKFSLFALTAMVVGSMVGAGIFSLPRTFATATGPFGAIIAWVIAAGGMYMLARVFQALAERKPDLDAGVYAYAKAGFGEYLGFLSAFGYFVSACLGNTFYWVLINRRSARFSRSSAMATRSPRSLSPRSVSGFFILRCCAGYSRPRPSTKSSPSPKWCRSCCLS
jgi:amino acid permease